MSLDKVNEETKIMTSTVESELNFDTEGAGMVPDNIFEKMLPEDITLELVERVDRHKLNVADAVTLAVGTKGIQHLKDHPELNSVSLKIKAGLDTIATEFHRSAERRNPSSGETFTKYGVASTKLVTGVGSNRGGYKKIQEHLSEEAKSVFNQ